MRRIAPLIRRRARSPGGVRELLALNSGSLARSGSATYLSSQGVVVTAAANVMRPEHRGDEMAWLLEGARTNGCTRSHEFDSWANISGDVVVNSDTQTAPNGAAEADEVEDPVDSDVTGKLQSALSVAAPASFSLWLLKDSIETRFPELQLRGTSTEVFQVNTETGASAIRAGSIVVQVEDQGDWWFVSGVRSVNTASDIRVYPAFSLSLGGFDVSAVGSVFVWGAQLETGSFPTSQIETSGATASRSVDVLTFATGGYPTRLVDGVFEFDFFPYFAEDEVSSDVILLSFGGSNDELRYNATSDAFEVLTSGVQRGIGSALTFSRHQKLTIKLDWNARECTVSGATTGNSTFALSDTDEWPSNVTMRVGGRQGTNGVEAFGRYSNLRAA